MNTLQTTDIITNSDSTLVSLTPSITYHDATARERVLQAQAHLARMSRSTAVALMTALSTLTPSASTIDTNHTTTQSGY